MAKRKKMDPDSKEKKEGKQQIRRPKKKETDPLTDSQKFVQDLQLHQVELEMENEELRNARHQVAILLHKYTQRYDLAPAGYFTLTPDGLICDLNIPGAALLGQERTSLVNREFGSFLSPGSQLVFTDFLAQVFGQKENESCEVTCDKPGDQAMTLLLEANVSSEEQVCYLIASDVTAYKMAEEAVKGQKELYRSVFQKIPLVTLLLDPESGEILDANPAATGFYGCPVSQLRKMKFSDLTILSPNEIDPLLRITVSGKLEHFIFKQKLPGGQIHYVKANLDPVQIDEKSYLLATIEDISDRRLTEEVNEERKFWSRESHQNTGTGSFSLDFSSDSWTASEFLRDILGTDPEYDSTISGFLSLVHPSQKAGLQYYLFSEVIARKQPFEKEFCIIRPADGSERWVKGVAELEFGDGGMLKNLSGTIRDITEKRRSEEALAEAEKMYQLLMNASPDGIVIFNPEGEITELSRVVMKQFGARNKEELLGKHFIQFIPADEKRKIIGLIDRTMVDGLPQCVECRLLKPDNSTIISEISLTQISRSEDDQKAFIAIIRDISNRKKKEQQLIHLDRMAHLGEMATGMAHEINQPLNNISITLDNVFHEIKLRDSLHDTYLQHKSDKIFDNIVKIKNLIEHIREFARDNHSYSFQTFDINETVRNALSILLVQFDEKQIDIVLDLDENMDLFVGDTYKVEQVMMNLLLNAKDALEEKGLKPNGSPAKFIKIRTFQEGKTICIEISDNGIGIKATEIDKIMHPFYTTKDTGKGVGLGLSISYGIISEMNGKIEVESKHLAGTTFRIMLPVTETVLFS